MVISIDYVIIKQNSQKTLVPESLFNQVSSRMLVIYQKDSTTSFFRVNFT